MVIDKSRKYLAHCLLQLGKGMGGQKKIAEGLGVTIKQVRLWEIGKVRMKKIHFRALRDLLREESKKGTKSAVQSIPACKYCNNEITINEVRPGRYTVYHTCPSGYTHKLPERSREETLRALAPVVSE